MATFEIYWDSLTSEAKDELIENGFKYDDNMGYYPIAMIEQEDEEQEEE